MARLVAWLEDLSAADLDAEEAEAQQYVTSSCETPAWPVRCASCDGWNPLRLVLYRTDFLLLLCAQGGLFLHVSCAKRRHLASSFACHHKVMTRTPVADASL